MKSVALIAFPRTLARRGGVKKLRTSGRIPAVIYGRMNKPQNVEVESKALEDVLHHALSENVLLDLACDGKQRLALLQDVQHHPLTGKTLHIDLHEVAENEKVTIMVPVETTGEALGVKTGGGILEHVLFKIKVRALPKDLPEVLLVDVTSLNIGQSIHLGDVKPPAGVELLGDKHISVLSVAAPMTEEQEAAAAAEATAATAGDVEMTKEKKEEGEEGEAKAGAAKGAEKAPAKGAAEKAPAAADKGAAKPAEKKK